jgi:hypothetical protein
MMMNCHYILMVSTILAIGTMQASSADLVIRGNEHAPIYISDTDSGRFDFNNDGLDDYYVKAHYTGNQKQTYKIDYKIQDGCVSGSSYDSATMKFGFTQKEIDFSKRVWMTENIEVWNPWFRSALSTDLNHKIDLIALPVGAIPIPYPSSGDNVVVGSSKNNQGSFIHKDSIMELDGQAGWEGSIFFNAPSGEYFLHTIHPSQSSCGGLVSLGIPIIIKPQ